MQHLIESNQFRCFTKHIIHVIGSTFRYNVLVELLNQHNFSLVQIQDKNDEVEILRSFYTKS